jgi:hypothetical protein
MGVFVVHPVGSTEYCQGLHVYAHLHEDDECAPGLFSFAAKLEQDGSVTWFQAQRNYVIRHGRAEEILEEGLRLARAWHERAPVHCAAYYGDLARKELSEHNRKVRQEKQAMEHLTQLLADPAEPRPRILPQHVVEGPTEWVPYTAEEAASMRNRWQKNLEGTYANIAKLEAKSGRVLQLEKIQALCRSGKANISAFPPVEVPNDTE